MAASPEVRNNTSVPPDQEAGHQRIRRAFLKGGLGAAPVLLTLVSRPVLGGQWRVVGGGGGGGGGKCFTPSGFVSMPTSQHGQTYYCSGRTPGYWKQSQHFGSWVPPYYPITKSWPNKQEATKFNDVFSPSPYPPDTTLLQVLELMGGPPNDVARHIVAALLNAAAGWTPVLTIAAIKGIWTEYMNTGGGTIGYFEPTAGVKWYHDDIVNYLLSTMPL